MYGSEKWMQEPRLLKRWGYRLFGELHVPGRIRSNHIIREIRRLGLMDRPVRMLDAGSGKGDLALHLARRCPRWEIVGVELSPAKVNNSRSVAGRLGLRNVSFQTGRLEELDLAGQFDLIVSADVLEHIEDDRRVLRSMFRALAPGGYLIITAPSIPHRQHLRLVHWRETRIDFHVSDYGHVRDGYSQRDIEEKFRHSGGRVVRSCFTYGFCGTLAFDVFFVIGDNQPNPVVFALCFPFLLALGVLDLHSRPRTGSAILAVGASSSEP